MRVAAAGVLAALALGATAGAAGPYRNGLVAFARCCGLPGTGIYVIGPDGRGQRQVFRPKADDAALNVAWSPDGSRLAFIPGAPSGGVWVMKPNGAGARRLTAGGGNALTPSWSPDGRSLLFAELPSARTELHDLYVMRSDGTRIRRLTKSASDETSPAWAPNGGLIVYARGRDLWRMKPDGAGQRLLLRDASSPSWSPAGTHLAFVRRGEPWIAARDGSGATRVAAVEAVAVAWSPDGRWLITAPGDRGDLMLVRTDGSAVRRLTHEPGYFHAWPAWQRVAIR